MTTTKKIKCNIFNGVNETSANSANTVRRGGVATINMPATRPTTPLNKYLMNLINMISYLSSKYFHNFSPFIDKFRLSIKSDFYSRFGLYKPTRSAVCSMSFCKLFNFLRKWRYSLQSEKIYHFSECFHNIVQISVNISIHDEQFKIIIGKTWN